MIVATAGHVDHGKTSLVHALTGVDTDRLPEEKRRGLTIDIGFAYLQMPRVVQVNTRADTGPSQSLALIDVPGHEKFVRNMIAGVGSVDLALVVVAADDGLMPQTYEHLSILSLMGVKSVLLVVSKVDLVSDEKAHEVRVDAAAAVRQAGLALIESFMYCVTDLDSVQRIKAELISSVSDKDLSYRMGCFRMAIDRSFTIAGSGTVVTGTSVSGTLEKNDHVSLLSDGTNHGKTARVRGMHVQNTANDKAVAGQRCALNLSGELSVSMLQRGDWISAGPAKNLGNTIDVVVSTAPFLDKLAIKHWTPAHLHLGTGDVMCRVALLEDNELKPGQSVFARLICDKPVFSAHGDHFVLRDQSARKTIAGGRVLDPLPPRRGRSKPARVKVLQALNQIAPVQVLKNLHEIEVGGVNLSQFSQRLNLTDLQVRDVASEAELTLIEAQSLWGIGETQSAAFLKHIEDTLAEFHKNNKDVLGADLLTLRKLLGQSINLEPLEFHLRLLLDTGKVKRTAAIFGLSSHTASLSQQDQQHWNIVVEAFNSAGNTPPRVRQLAELICQSTDDTFSFLNRCVALGKISKVTANRYFLPSTLNSLAKTAYELSESDSLSVAGFRDKSGMGRNLVIELLEYFDRCRYTQRQGDKRLVIGKQDSVY